MDGRIEFIFPPKMRACFERENIDFKGLQEIRIRLMKPVFIKYQNEEFYLSTKRGMTRREEYPYIVDEFDMRKILECISNYSLYAYEEQVKRGFITLKGGHRVGMAGQVVLEHHTIKTMQYITFLNIRVAHEVIGCCERVFPFCRKNNQMLSVLIISPPGCGKTTLLRDMIRKASTCGQTVGLVDERSEIAACYHGVAQNDVGIRTDILDGCPKAQGFQMLVRSMAPDLMAVDEIGTKEDVMAIKYGLSCGCNCLATIHGNTVESIPYFEQLRHMFQRFIFLDQKNKVGHISKILDEKGNQISW